ncbi:MAG: cob(I)yrinic acid a,c-diamide adenosyltransferase [Bacillota bacterium]
MKGKVQVYTGDGKGKTTAAIGLAIRAAGAGKSVFIGQFIKGMEYSEIKMINKIAEIKLKQYGRGCFIKGDPETEDIKAAKEGLNEIGKILKSGEYELVILDEANIAVYYKLFSVDTLISVIENRAENVEVVITGRKADDKLIKYADLVTNMEEIKHYYHNGVKARTGIEK